jgi:CBS domain containing-hemolysin-like protein
MKSKSRNNFNFKKLINFFFILFGKKNKKSLSFLINHITETYETQGFITSEEKKMLKNIVNFGDKKINTIMVPRSDIIAIPENITLDEIKKIITEDEHTRIPVYKDNIDHIVGFIHSKDLAKFLCNINNDFNLPKIIRKILFMPCSTKLIDALLKMRSSRVHVAIVLDEFGAVDGLVTIENLIEEIVGQIDDEHDVPLESSFFQIKKIDEKTYQFGGRVELKNFEEIFKIKFEDCSAETVGGLVMATFKAVPKIGDKIEKSQLIFKVLDADKRMVKSVEIKALYDL